MAIRMRGMKGAGGAVERDGKNADLTLTYELYDPAVDPESAGYFLALYNHVIANAPATLLDLERGRITFKEDSEGSDRFTFDVAYSSYVPPDSAIRWGWDTTGGNVRIFTSKATTRYAVSGRTAPDHKNAIGVKDKEVEGVDIVTPTLKLTATYRHLQIGATINDSNYRATIKAMAGMTGTTNNATFETYAQGELLFLGSTGEYVPGKDTEVQYHFAASANATGLTFGNIASVAKKGHDYVWIAFEAVQDGSASNALTKRPTFAYVERVYGESNFDTFGIN